MFIGRNPDGTIYGLWTVRQWAGQEELPDDDPAVITFLTKPVTDVPGFISDLKTAMGGIVASNGLAKSYPLFYPALEQGIWADVQTLILDAHATLVLSDLQYGAMKQLAAKHNIPVVLP